jgi:hypothetical protein
VIRYHPSLDELDDRGIKSTNGGILTLNANRPISRTMIYMNMGHGEYIFDDATQNMLFIAGLRWIVEKDKKGNVFLEY